MGLLYKIATRPWLRESTRLGPEGLLFHAVGNDEYAVAVPFYREVTDLFGHGVSFSSAPHAGRSRRHQNKTRFLLVANAGLNS
jgi:hypothetical protein